MPPGSEERKGYLEHHVPSRVATKDDFDIKCDRVPDGFICLDGEAPVTSAPYFHYLRQRGITDEVRSLYRVGHVDGRIVVPSFDMVGMVNFWSARTIYQDTVPVYRLPEATKDIISNDYLTDWTQPIYLVEGIFDEMAIGPQAISLYGKFLGPTLAQKIVRKRPPIVYVCLDDDARHEAVRLTKRLVGYDISCCLLDLPGKDPGTMGGDAVREFALGASVITGSAGLVSAIGRL